jgi:predicted transposase/invertase (TIGR01784 family)
MLFTEWNWDDALAVRFEEGREEGIEEGMEKGMEKGREKGREEGREEIARNALMEGIPTETIQKITGLDMETIRHITP